MDKIEVLLREYETLRQESLESMTNRAQIVSFGLATVGILFAGILSSDTALKKPMLLLMVFSLAVPVACFLVLYMWLGEVERMMRAGDFLVELERRINRSLEPNGVTAILRWETDLRSSGTQMHYPYIVVILLFLGLAVGSPLVGLVAGSLELRRYWLAVGAPWFIESVVVIHVFIRTRRFRSNKRVIISG